MVKREARGIERRIFKKKHSKAQETAKKYRKTCPVSVVICHMLKLLASSKGFGFRKPLAKHVGLC